MDEDIRQSLDEIKRELRALRSELVERIERVETSLLTESHKPASAMELRACSRAAVLRVLNLEAFAERVNILGYPPIS